MARYSRPAPARLVTRPSSPSPRAAGRRSRRGVAATRSPPSPARTAALVACAARCKSRWASVCAESASAHQHRRAEEHPEHPVPPAVRAVHQRQRVPTRGNAMRDERNEEGDADDQLKCTRRRWHVPGHSGAELPEQAEQRAGRARAREALAHLQPAHRLRPVHPLRTKTQMHTTSGDAGLWQVEEAAGCTDRARHEQRRRQQQQLARPVARGQRHEHRDRRQ